MSLIETLSAACSPDAIRTDEASRRLYSQDVWTNGAMVDAVLSPSSEAELSDILRACSQSRTPIYPRGGGMSYTAAFLAEAPGGVCLDTAGLDQIFEINREDMYVRAGAGVTWAALHDALQDTGLRTPFWGPLSGILSTLGGGLSQNNAFFGAGTYGPSGDSVLSLSVALADGSILKTGSAGGTGASPFFRAYGPDLTGLFIGDAGALGVKTEATLKLIPAPEHERWGSLSFPDRDSLVQAASDMARENLACEIFGFDPGLTAVRLQRASIMSDAKTLAKVVTGQGGLLKGLKEGVRMAMAGREFLDQSDYNLHFVTEGASKAGVDDAHGRLMRLGEAAGGQSVEPTIPKVIRANPFTPLNNMIGPSAERWVPAHGIVPHSQASACWAALDDLFEAHEAAFADQGVTTGYLVTTVGLTGFLIEPVFLWPDALFDLHRQSVEGAHLGRLKPQPPNPAATTLVAQLRKAVVAVLQAHGAAHFQIGKTYPYAQTRSPETLALLSAIKAALDPHSIMNPGALGLGGRP